MPSFDLGSVPSVPRSRPAAGGSGVAASGGGSPSGAGGGLFPPSSAASSTRGVVGGVGDAGVVSLLWVESVEDICGGVIGGSEAKGAVRFCTRSDGCTTRSHAANKAPLAAGNFYVRTLKADQARLEPSVALSWLPAPLTKDSLLAERKAPAVWRAFLQDIESSRSLMEAGEDLLVVDVSEYAAAATMASPRRGLARSSPLASDDASLLLEIPEELTPLSEDPDAAASTDPVRSNFISIIDDWDSIRSNFLHLQNAINGVRRGQRALRDGMATDVEALAGRMQRLQAQDQLLSARIGQGAGSDETLSEQVIGLRAAVESVHSQQALFQDAGVLDFVTRWSSDLPVLGRAFDQLFQHYSDNVAVIIERFDQLETDVKAAALPAASPPRAVPPSLSSPRASHPSPGVIADMVEAAVNRRIADLRHEMDPGRTSSFFPSVSPAAGRHGDDVEDRLARVERRVDQALRLQSDHAITADGVTFASFEDVRDWMESNDVQSVGLFWDMFSLLVSMHSKTNKSGKDRADEGYSASRVSATVNEIDLAASMGHLRPVALFAKGGRGEIASPEEGLAAAATWNKWANGMSSYRSIVSGSYRSYLNGLRGQTPHCGNPVQAAMAGFLYSKAESHWHSLVGFIQSFYQDLTTASNFQASTAWNLVGRCVCSVFDEMCLVRSESSLVAGAMSDIDSKAKVFWSVLRCHRILDALVEVDFHGHPALARALSMYQLTERVDRSELKTVQAELKNVRVLAQDAMDEAERSSKKAADAKRTGANAKNEVNQHKKKNSGN